MADLEPTYATPFLTPLNLLLLALFLLTFYFQIRPRPAPAHPRTLPPTVFQTFTPRTLQAYNGLPRPGGPARIYLAIRRRVFDVSAAPQFYGPRGPYAAFGGHDASRGLAKGSFDPDEAGLRRADYLTGPLDGLADLTVEEHAALVDWEERFEEKYPVVGRLVEEEGEKMREGEAGREGGEGMGQAEAVVQPDRA
ncbi:MAG: hypothetical protein M1826_004830 [Phylliscum demangeonii]|nr:MAG: hypothetical protein M1826_004830 [Phylliscum demangeonii]